MMAVVAPTAAAHPPPTPVPGLDPNKPVKRALPVVPAPAGGNIQVRRAEPVRPMDQAQAEPLLQASPPPSIDFNDGSGHP